MEKEFVPYGLALRMKVIGFDEPCFALYKNSKFRFEIKDCNSIVDFYNRDGKIVSYLAPTFSQAFRWFREKYKFYCYPEPTGSWRYTCKYRGEDKKGKHWSGFLKDISDNILFFNAFEEAELECLKKLIEIVEKQ
jgi:hypothetical protein